MCKLANLISYTVLSQNFHFCFFRAITYIRLWNWQQFCLLYWNLKRLRNAIHSFSCSIYYPVAFIYVYMYNQFCFFSCILFYVACVFVICLIKYLLTYLLTYLSLNADSYGQCYRCRRQEFITKVSARIFSDAEEDQVDQETRLPSNQKPTTRECVHSVTRGHFWSCDKDGSHTIQSDVADTFMLHTNFVAVCFILTRDIADQFDIARTGILDHFCSCDLDLDQMTFICELDLHLLRYTVCATRCSAIAKRPRCRVRYIFGQKWKTTIGR